MRNLNECRAEVFRRSENRIKERKKRRNRMLACCIPLVLCVTVLVSTGLLDRSPGDAGGTVSPFVSVYGGGTTGRITDPAQVEQINARLEEFFVTGDGNSDSGSIGDLGISPPPASPGGETETYTILISLPDGSRGWYTLEGNELHDQKNQETVELTDRQIASLKSLLGLSERSD